MAYVYLPPRLTNYAPPGPPYLAGLRGLGDYAADLAAYKLAKLAYVQNHAVWAAQQKSYAAAVAAYQSRQTTVNKLNAALAKVYTKKSQDTATAYSLSLPQSYYLAGACLSKADHDAAVKKYQYSCTTVKGLGSWGGDPGCGMPKLPVCGWYKNTLAVPKSPGPEPQPPAGPPTAPVVVTTPTPVVVTTPTPVVTAPPVDITAPPPPAPTPYTPPPVTTQAPPSSGGGGGSPSPVSTPGDGPFEILPPSPPHQAGMVASGLILLAVAAGGYLVYRTLRPKKAAA